MNHARRVRRLESLNHIDLDRVKVLNAGEWLRADSRAFGHTTRSTETSSVTDPFDAEGACRGAMLRRDATSAHEKAGEDSAPYANPSVRLPKAGQVTPLKS